MRKYQQKQILELVKTLDEAHAEIKRLNSLKESSSVIQILADCQNCAVQIGNYIERIQGEGTQTVALLEEYCELLYKASKGEIKEKPLQKQLIKIKNSVMFELKPKRVEIAFFSYKASMSDSIESIYLAAKSHPDCDAYWIPIPYFDRNSDGSFGSMHFEGAEFYSDDIECIDWHKYDIESRCPDVIFTFNPYDAGNYVTSVHPDFYCERLRNFTDMLVYVPYFVAADNIQEDFCTVAGCMFAHKVIVQSEIIRGTYIRAFKARYGNTFGKPEDKFIALGSPKFDKVINTKRGDCSLPENWRKLIGGKKIVLYNTTIGALLRGDEQYLKKLCFVLDEFHGRDDVILWWRPHPLNEAAFQSMRPQLLDEYKQIVSSYRHEGWGIYDDTPDLHRAIAASDAYYGDGSSLLQLYQCHAKPVILQNVKICDSNNVQDNIAINVLFDSGDAFWATALYYNALFKIDKVAWEAEYVGSFPGEKPFALKQFFDVINHGRFLFFSPACADAIAVYDLENCAFQRIEIPAPARDIDSKVKYDKRKKLTRILELDGRLLLFPSTFPGIIEVNISGRSVEIIDDWLEPLDKLVFDSELGYFSNGIFDDKRNCVVIACANANAVVELDIDTRKTAVRKLGGEKNGYVDIVCLDDSYWLLSRFKPSLVRLDLANNDYREYEIQLPGVSANEPGLFQKLVHLDNSLFLIPFKSDRMLRFYLNGHNFDFVDSLTPENKNSDVPPYFPLRFNWNGNIYLNMRKNNCLLEYEPLTGSSREGSVRVKNTENYGELKEYLLTQGGAEPVNSRDCVFREYLSFDTLNALLEAIVQPVPPEWLARRLERQAGLLRSENSCGDGDTGREILRECIRAVLG